MKKEKLSAITIVLFVISVLLLFYTGYAFINSTSYLEEMALQQPITTYQMISYYFKECCSPFLWALMLYVMGEINQKVKIEVHLNKDN